MKEIQIIENSSEREKVLKVVFQEEGYKINIPGSLSEAWTDIMNINLRPELVIISLQDLKNKFILRLLSKAFPNLPAIILYRHKDQYQDLNLQENWHLVKIPFNPTALVEWVERILSGVH